MNDFVAASVVPWFTPCPDPRCVIVLMVIRVLAVFTLLMAVQAKIRHWRHDAPLGNALFTVALVGLLLMQAVGALSVKLPTVPPPSRFMLLINGFQVLLGVGVYFKYVPLGRKRHLLREQHKKGAA